MTEIIARTIHALTEPVLDPAHIQILHPVQMVMVAVLLIVMPLMIMIVLPSAATVFAKPGRTTPPALLIAQFVVMEHAQAMRLTLPALLIARFVVMEHAPAMRLTLPALLTVLNLKQQSQHSPKSEFLYYSLLQWHFAF